MKQIRPEGQLSIGEIFAQLATLIKPAPGKTYDYADLKARCNAKQLTEEERTEEEPVLYIGHTARTLFKRTNWKTFLTEDTLCDILAYYIHQQTPSAFINFPNADIKSAIVFGWTGIDPDFIDKGEASMFDTPHSFYRHEDKEIGVAHLIPPIMAELCATDPDDVWDINEHIKKLPISAKVESLNASKVKRDLENKRLITFEIKTGVRYPDGSLVNPEKVGRPNSLTDEERLNRPAVYRQRVKEKRIAAEIAAGLRDVDGQLINPPKKGPKPKYTAEERRQRQYECVKRARERDRAEEIKAGIRNPDGTLIKGQNS